MKREKLQVMRLPKNGSLVIKWSGCDPKRFNRIEGMECVTIDIGEHRSSFTIHEEAASAESLFSCLTAVIHEAIKHDALSYAINCGAQEEFAEASYPWKPQYFSQGMQERIEAEIRQKYYFEYQMTQAIRNIDLNDFLNTDCLFMQWQIRRDYELLGKYNNIDDISEYSVCVLEGTANGRIRFSNLNGTIVHESETETEALEYLSSWQQKHEVRMLIFKGFMPSQYFLWNTESILNDGTQVFSVTAKDLSDSVRSLLSKVAAKGLPKPLLS